jgi:hypothetical protein
MSNPGTDGSQNAAIGPALGVSAAGFGVTSAADGAVTGENPESNGAAAMALAALAEVSTAELTPGEAPDLSYATEFAVEVWFKTDSMSAGGGADRILAFPLSGGPGSYQCEIDWNSNGQLTAWAYNNSATFISIVAGAITAGVWHHIVLTAVGSTMTLYINNVAVGTNTWSGSVQANNGNDPYFVVGDPAGGVSNVYFDEVAVYRHGLTADRVAAHYIAGTQRGFARGQDAGERIGHLLDAVQSQAPRALDAGTRPLAGQWTGDGQSTLQALREAENAEAVDAVMFIAKDGTVTFLDADHRSVSPHDTVQAVFGDAGGSELDFMDISLDYSDAFLANSWTVTRDNGVTQSAEDDDSIAAFGKRTQSLSGLKLRDDSDADDVADAMLAKYQDPFQRVLSITPKTMDTTVLDTVFGLELGDRITVKLTPMGGGSRFEQTLFIQSISIDATPQQVYPRVVLGVSPV